MTQEKPDPPLDTDDLSGIADVAKQLVEGSRRSRSVRVAKALKAAHKVERERLEEAATLDPLTNALNRRGFADAHRQIVARHERDQEHDVLGSTLVIDVDKFKEINDTLGHAGGDAALVKTVENAREMFRPYDVIGRAGGDEFWVLMPGAAPETAAERAYELRALNEASGASLSIGVAPMGEDLNNTLKQADQMAYESKAHGGNTVFYLDENQQPVRYVPSVEARQQIA